MTGMGTVKCRGERKGVDAAVAPCHSEEQADGSPLHCASVCDLSPAPLLRLTVSALKSRLGDSLCHLQKVLARLALLADSFNHQTISLCFLKENNYRGPYGIIHCLLHLRALGHTSVQQTIISAQNKEKRFN